MLTTTDSSFLCSEIVFSFLLLVISGLVLVLLRYFLPLRRTPFYLLIPIFLALALPASIILLVPIDLASNARDPELGIHRGILLPTGILLTSWRILYWETFFLTWFILPILAEYADAGYRDIKARLFWSLKRSLGYQATLLASGLILMIYLFVHSGVSPNTFKAILMATAYFWGLTFAIYLMGHGLVSIPRRFFQNANLRKSLDRLYIHTAHTYENLTDAIHHFECLEAQIVELRRRKSSLGLELQDWIDELSDDIETPRVMPPFILRQNSSPDIYVPRVITEHYLADLSRKISRARHSKARYQHEWDRTEKKACTTRNTLEGFSAGKIQTGQLSTRDISTWQKYSLLTPRTRFYFRCYLLPNMNRLLGILFSLASFFIVWSELIKPINPHFSIIALTIIHHPNNENGEIGLAGQIIAAGWILYMCFAALISLTEVKVWRGRALVRRNTHGESAMWYSYQVAKLSVPLAFNFLTFLDPDIYKRTVFYGFLGNLINLTPLSSWFDTLWPVFILFPVCATLFGLYGKLYDCIGYGDIINDGQESHDSNFSSVDSWSEGKRLIDEACGVSTRNQANRYSDQQDNVPSASNVYPTPTFPVYQVNGHHNINSPTIAPNRQFQNEDPGSDENSMRAFGHRLRNTVETFQTPKWFQNIGETVKLPHWMGPRERAPESHVDRLDNSRWLGGNQQGRLRL
ncbi:BgTH12-03488 [Blumeria graminis f. sp. triticale]|nr:BgTH12-03488 [Blumeria graminis f. sp. triticale]